MAALDLQTSSSGSDAFRTARWNSVHIAFCSQGPDAHDLLGIRRELETFSRELDAPVGGLVLITEDCDLPTQAGRREAARMIYELYPRQIAFCAVVLEGTGLRSLAQRSALSLISVLSRASLPWDVFRTAEEATRWLLPRVDNLHDSTAVLAQTLAELRAPA